MNAYRFSYVGGTMIVIAHNKDEATKIAKEQLKYQKYIETLELEGEISIVKAFEEYILTKKEVLE